MSSRRALHFVFKVADRKQTTKFYLEVLGMKVLRHEEFEEACKATCNGPYDGIWSKTMIGYGPEEDHFVVELAYNYGVKSYKMGNGFIGLTISSSDIAEKAKANGWTVGEENNMKFLEAPGGYRFFLTEKTERKSTDPVQKVTLAISDLKKSIDYWHGVLGMTIYEQDEKSVLLGYSDEQCKVELKKIEEPINHAKSFGRIAFSCPTADLQGIEAAVKRDNQKILNPLISLDTPGKATVHVVILADPDGHEVCFVGDEAFRELSKVDEKSEASLQQAIAEDKSHDELDK